MRIYSDSASVGSILFFDDNGNELDINPFKVNIKEMNGPDELITAEIEVPITEVDLNIGELNVKEIDNEEDK